MDINSSRLEFLDAGRGLAILGVIAVHTVGNFKTGLNKLDFLISTGQFGVQLFFIISAYTMMLTLEGRINKEKYYFVNFWLRRFSRIAIPFWVAIIVYQVFRFLNVPYFASTSSDPFAIITSFFLVQDFWPSSLSSIVPGGGSIATEVAFYMIFPIIFLMRGSMIKIALFGILMIALDRLIIRPTYLSVFTLSNAQFTSKDINQFFHYYMFNQLPVFLFGIFTYHFFMNHKRGIGLRKLDVFSILSFLLLFCIVSPPLMIISAIGAVVLYSLKKLATYPRWLLWIGSHSYSLYLFHFSILNAMLMIGGGRPNQHGILIFLLAYGVAIICSMLVSIITKPLFEDTGSAVGRYLVKLNERRNTL